MEVIIYLYGYAKWKEPMMKQVDRG